MLSFVRSFVRNFRKKLFSYEPLVEVHVSKEALLHNLHTYQKVDAKVAVAPVLKSNAYGHGLFEVGRILEKEVVPFVCVDSYFEALMLRNEDLSFPILILDYTPLENIVSGDLRDVSFGIVSLEELYRLAKVANSPTRIHLKIDTGMHRQGVALEDVDEAIRFIKANRNLELEGVFSHLADAETPDSEHAAMQIARWNALAKRFRTEFRTIRFFHLAATSGVYHLKNIDSNVMRIGIGLYGMHHGLLELPLRPILEMTTRITSVRALKKGESVGYNATFTAPTDMKIATIPVGYSEGLDRRLSNKGSVRIRERECPIVGRVSMNITSVDVSSVPDTELDEAVLVISDNQGDTNTIQKMADLCGTISYEILVRIPSHLRRIVV